MATRADFTQDEWDLIRRSLTAVSGLVATASPSGLIGLGKEMFAAAGAIADAKKTPTGNVLIDALVTELASQPSDADKAHTRAEAEEQLETLKGKPPTEVSALLTADLRSVAALLDSKTSADEAAGFKRWLLGIAQRVAGAAKEGGFLGIGGTAVSPEEQAAVQSVADALGIPA
jgi:hypothetical protein